MKQSTIDKPGPDLPWTVSWAPCLTETTRASVWLGSSSSIGRIRSARINLGSGCRRSGTGAVGARALMRVSVDVAPQNRLQKGAAADAWPIDGLLMPRHQISSQYRLWTDLETAHHCHLHAVMHAVASAQSHKTSCMHAFNLRAKSMLLMVLSRKTATSCISPSRCCCHPEFECAKWCNATTGGCFTNNSTAGAHLQSLPGSSQRWSRPGQRLDSKEMADTSCTNMRIST